MAEGQEMDQKGMASLMDLDREWKGNIASRMLRVCLEKCHNGGFSAWQRMRVGASSDEEFEEQKMECARNCGVKYLKSHRVVSEIFRRMHEGEEE